MATNQEKLDAIFDPKHILQAQVPLNKGDKAFHGTRHSVEHLLYLGMYYGRDAAARAARLEKSVSTQNATIANLVSALAAVAKGEPFDQAKLLAGVRAAAKEGAEEGAREGVAESIDSIDVTVNTKGGAPA